jgi:glucose/arabinose dehydrogenase
MIHIRSKRSKRPRFLAATILSAGILTLGESAAVDLGTYKGCAAGDGDFTLVPLAVKGKETTEPLKMAFSKRGDGVVDVFFVERTGAVKKYDGSAKTVSTVGTIPAAIGNEDGLTGIATDPDFPDNHYFYFSYAFQAAGDTSIHISRIPYTANGSLDLAAEKILIKIPSKRMLPHTGGAMQFDAYGDLWITVGDNSSAEGGPGNTADLRGGILRIHPDDKLPSGYSIPKGNFGEHFAAKFKTSDPALSLQYADPAKVRPEIYVKGTRNAYSMSLDPVRRWLSWGDVGPDFGAISEENNLVKEPFYMGWPYFAGSRDVTSIYGFNFTKKDRAKPVNSSSMAGVTQLPANREPIYLRQQNCAMNGPIIRYDGVNPNPGQLPPQLDRKWLIGDCNGSYGTHLLTLNAAGDSVIGDVKVFNNLGIAVLVDMQQGPDGALYYIGWQSGLYRADYKGTCKDPALLAERSGCADPSDPAFDPKLNPAFHDPRRCGKSSGVAMPALSRADWASIGVEGVEVRSAGPHSVRATDMGGREVFSTRGEGPRSYGLPALPRGIYQVSVRTREGWIVNRVSRL